MKIRFDFVTNSSSSSFVTFGIISHELQQFIKEMDSDGLIDHWGDGSIKGPEACSGIEEWDNVINITRDLSNMSGAPGSLIAYNKEEGESLSESEKKKDQKKMLKSRYAYEAIADCLNGMSDIQEKELKTIVQSAFDEGHIGCKVYTDYTDGFCGEKVDSMDIERQNREIGISSENKGRKKELVKYIRSNTVRIDDVIFHGMKFYISPSVNNSVNKKRFENGQFLEAAEIIIRKNGGKLSKTLTDQVDYCVVADYYLKPENINIGSALTDYTKIQNGNTNRVSEGLNDIKILLENDFVEWVVEQYSIHKKDGWFKSYGELFFKFIPSKGDIQFFDFKSAHFAELTKAEMKEAIDGCSSINQLIDNVEKITKQNAISRASITKANSMLKLDKKFAGLLNIAITYMASDGEQFFILCNVDKGIIKVEDMVRNKEIKDTLEGKTFSVAGFDDNKENTIKNIVEDSGGRFLYNFTSDLDYLIFDPNIETEPIKIKKAKLFNSKGASIKIMPIDEFYDLINKD